MINSTYTILVVDDCPQTLTQIGTLLSPHYSVKVAKSGWCALQSLKQHPLPDLILLDVCMPEMDGYELLEKLRRNEATAKIPLIFLTGKDSTQDEEIGLAMGAVDYITKPIRVPIFLARVRTQLHLKLARDILEDKGAYLEKEVERRIQQSQTDELTQIPNRRAFDDRLDVNWREAYRRQEPISLLFIDIDNFKKFNDQHGHDQADEALRRVAKALQSTTHRPVDIACRWGGEEFVVLLPNTNALGANLMAQQIQAVVNDLMIPLRNSESTKVTVSIGTATMLAKDALSMHDLIRRADAAMLEAKRNGRDRIVQSEE